MANKQPTAPNRFMGKKFGISFAPGTTQGVQNQISQRGGLPLAPNVGQSSQTQPLQAPTSLPNTLPQSPLAQGFNQFRDQLGTPTFVRAPELSSQFANFQAPQVTVPTGPQQIAGTPASFFESQKQQLTEQLRNEFFGGGGKFEGALANESAAGRLGSGVARRILQQTVTEPFAQAQVDIGRNVLQAQLQDQARVEQFNAQQAQQFAENRLAAEQFNAQERRAVTDRIARLAEVDSGNALKAQLANQSIQTEFNSLAERLATAQTAQEISILENQIKAWEAAQKLRLDFNSQRQREKELALQFEGITFPEGTGQGTTGVGQSFRF